MIGGELDATTPPQIATRELLPYLSNGHQVVLKGFGHTTDFWTQQTAAGSRLVNTFFDTGRVDDSLYQPGIVDFSPTMSQPGIAKIVAGSLALLAAITVVSLALMVWRVHRNGRFGPKAAAVLRSVWAAVIGLGGWVIGILTVLITWPGMPIDDQLLVVVSAGLPVGLATYLAWVHRDWTSRTRHVGLAAAVAGAFAGAWLGFHATTQALAILTAVAGAVAGANLALILLDMSRAAHPAPTSADGPRDVGDEHDLLAVTG